MVLKKVVAGFLVVCLLAWPWYDVVEAQTFTTDRGTFTLTSTGVTKIQVAQQTVSNAVGLLGLLGRISAPVMIGFAVFEAVTQFWDWWSRDYQVSGAGIQSTQTGSWGLTATNNTALGVFTQSGYGYVLCGSGSPWPGVKQWVLGSEPSFVGKMVVGAVTSYQGSYDCYTTALQLMAAPTISSTVRTTSTGTTGRAEMIAAVDAVLGEIATGSFQAANGTGQQQVAGTTELVGTLQAARNVLSNGVELISGTDYTGSPASSGNPAVIGPMPGAVPLPGEPFVSSSSTPASSGTDMTATNQKLDQMLNTPASPASAEVCPECSRADKWTELWDTIKTAAAAAPIFGLLARLAWPGVGTVQRQWTLGSWQGHQMSIDLDNSGIGTAITVVRFVVIGGAVIVAYMIIFA